MDNAAALFIDGPVHEGHGDRAALVTPSGPVTYASLQRLTDRAAHGLRALGVEPEQRVAIRLPDGPAWAATFFGAIKLGAVAVPINTRLAPAALGTVLADCRPKVLVTQPTTDIYGEFGRNLSARQIGAILDRLPPDLVSVDREATGGRPRTIFALTARLDDETNKGARREDRT